MCYNFVMQNTRQAKLLLRLGLALVFLYAAVGAALAPSAWIGYFPQFIRDSIPVPERVLLGLFSAYELLLALWVISGWKTFYAALVSALTILGIMVANFGLLEVIFRDVAIFFAALALMALQRRKEVEG